MSSATSGPPQVTSLLFNGSLRSEHFLIEEVVNTPYLYMGCDAGVEWLSNDGFSQAFALLMMARFWALSSEGLFVKASEVQSVEEGLTRSFSAIQFSVLASTGLAFRSTLDKVTIDSASISTLFDNKVGIRLAKAKVKGVKNSKKSNNIAIDHMHNHNGDLSLKRVQRMYNKFIIKVDE